MLSLNLLHLEFTLENCFLNYKYKSLVYFVPRYKILNSIILTEYANKLPEEVKDLLLGFSSPENLGLLAALMERGKMSFNEMKQEFKLSSSSLTNRLNVLQNGNLVKNFYEKTDGRGFSYYDVTDVFQQIFGSVYEILYSPTSTEKTESVSIADEILQFAYDEPFRDLHHPEFANNPITTTKSIRSGYISGNPTRDQRSRMPTREQMQDWV